MLLADGRMTASAWLVAGGVRDDWDRFYDCLTQVGKRSGVLAGIVLNLVVKKFPSGRFLLAIDDSPTSRFGRHVEGAVVHHNPTPGPADGQWLYGHNWVCLAFLARHSSWGVIALPLRSMLYVRKVNLPALKKTRLEIPYPTPAVRIVGGTVCQRGAFSWPEEHDFLMCSERFNRR